MSVGLISYHFFIVRIERLFNQWEFLMSQFLKRADQPSKLQRTDEFGGVS